MCVSCAIDIDIDMFLENNKIHVLMSMARTRRMLLTTDTHMLPCMCANNGMVRCYRINRSTSRQHTHIHTHTRITLHLDASCSIRSRSMFRAHISTPQIDGQVDESTSTDEYIDMNRESFAEQRLTHVRQLIELYRQWSQTRFARVQFILTSDDGYRSQSENLDQAWSTVVDQVRMCRDEMNLTHLTMNANELNGHAIFGLTKPIVKVVLHRLYMSSLSLSVDTTINPMILPLSSATLLSCRYVLKKKFLRKKSTSLNSRLTIYERKQQRRQPFAWLTHSLRNIPYAVESFNIDDALAYAR
jgi:hypothetical protein